MLESLSRWVLRCPRGVVIARLRGSGRTTLSKFNVIGSCVIERSELTMALSVVGDTVGRQGCVAVPVLMRKVGVLFADGDTTRSSAQ